MTDTRMIIDNPRGFSLVEMGERVAEVEFLRFHPAWPDRMEAAYATQVETRTAAVVEALCRAVFERGFSRLRFQCASRDRSLREFFEACGFRFRGVYRGAALLERILGAEQDQRAPFDGAERYRAAGPLPVSVLLENVRSQHNVGSFFRTVDGAGAGVLRLCGITPRPPARTISKTALGAEERVSWRGFENGAGGAEAARAAGEQLVAIETSAAAEDLFDWEPRFPVCIAFGSEVDGLSPELLAEVPVRVRLPMLGVKHSLNVATAGGIVLYELLRKHRCRMENNR